MQDPLSVARSLRPLVEAEADASDRQLTMSKPVVDAFASTGLNHLQVPRELGGHEVDTDTALDVLEEVAHQDGSIGWTYMANANATAFCAMFDPEIARDMLDGRPEVVCAGQFVPCLLCQDFRCTIDVRVRRDILNAVAGQHAHIIFQILTQLLFSWIF